MAKTKKIKDYTYAERQELASNKIKLDGKEAVIIGLRDEFATVRQYPFGIQVEFAWSTVDHIIKNRDGKFKS